MGRQVNSNRRLHRRFFFFSPFDFWFSLFVFFFMKTWRSFYIIAIYLIIILWIHFCIFLQFRKKEKKQSTYLCSFITFDISNKLFDYFSQPKRVEIPHQNGIQTIIVQNILENLWNKRRTTTINNWDNFKQKRAKTKQTQTYTHIFVFSFTLKYILTHFFSNKNRNNNEIQRKKKRNRNEKKNKTTWIIPFFISKDAGRFVENRRNS